MVNFHGIKRFELIDHTGGHASCYPNTPRMVIAKNVTVEFAVQDDGKTLKIFLTEAPHVAGETG